MGMVAKHSSAFILASPNYGVIDAFVEISKFKSVIQTISKLKSINFGAFGLILSDNLGSNGNIGYISLTTDIYQNYTNLHKIGYEYGWTKDLNKSVNLLTEILEPRYILNPSTGFICLANKEIHTIEVEFDLTTDFASYSRSARITKLLTEAIQNSKIDWTHMLEILYDNIDLYAVSK